MFFLVSRSINARVFKAQFSCSGSVQSPLSVSSQHASMTLKGHHHKFSTKPWGTPGSSMRDHGFFLCNTSERKLPSTKLQRLERQSGNEHQFVLLVLLKSHERFGDALRILVQREDAPGSLHRLQVSCFLEELHQDVLVDVLEDVWRRFLAVRRVKLVAAHGGTDAARVWRRVWRHGGLNRPFSRRSVFDRSCCALSDSSIEDNSRFYRGLAECENSLSRWCHADGKWTPNFTRCAQQDALRDTVLTQRWT